MNIFQKSELIKKVTLALHSGLTFDGKIKNCLMSKLNDVANVMEGYRKSFQYIQDYININSLKIWHEEITYIIHVALEEECKDSTWTPGRNWKMYIHEDKSETSGHGDGNGASGSFMGRLARELIRITDPKYTIYGEHSLAWYDLKTQGEVLDHRVFSMILKAIGTPGLFGLDKLLSYYTYVELGGIYKHVEGVRRDKSWMNMFEECRGIISNSELSRNNPGKLYSVVMSHGGRVLPQVMESLLKIGHYQLLRSKIAYELNTGCKFEAKHMEAALRTLNSALLFELGKKGGGEVTKVEENKLINELSMRLDWAGISDHLNKTYVKFPEGSDLDLMIFVVSVCCLHKLYYCKNTASLLSKKIQDPVDAVVFTIGVHTLLKQFDEDILESYVSFLCKYVMSFVSTDGGKIGSEWEAEGTTVLQYLQLISRYSNIPKSAIFNHIPVIIVDQYKKVK